MPVAAGAGAILSLTADHEPSLAAAGVALALFCALAWVLRARRAKLAVAAALAAYRPASPRRACAHGASPRP
ncbi:MAG: hypothetical protein U1E30_05010 [Rhodoblastus sp.]